MKSSQPAERIRRRGPSHDSSSDHKPLAVGDLHWPSVLDQFDVQYLMLATDRDTGLLDLFQSHPGWVIDSQDDRAVLMVRTDVDSIAAESKVGR